MKGTKWPNICQGVAEFPVLSQTCANVKAMQKVRKRKGKVFQEIIGTPQKSFNGLLWFKGRNQKYEINTHSENTKQPLPLPYRNSVNEGKSVENVGVSLCNLLDWLLSPAFNVQLCWPVRGGRQRRLPVTSCALGAPDLIGKTSPEHEINKKRCHKIYHVSQTQHWAWQRGNVLRSVKQH